jgi:hypothetical protein
VHPMVWTHYVHSLKLYQPSALVSLVLNQIQLQKSKEVEFQSTFNVINPKNLDFYWIIGLGWTEKSNPIKINFFFVLDLLRSMYMYLCITLNVIKHSTFLDFWSWIWLNVHLSIQSRNKLSYNNFFFSKKLFYYQVKCNLSKIARRWKK